MVVSQNKGTLLETPKILQSFSMWTPNKVPLILGNPHIYPMATFCSKPYTLNPKA